MAGPSTGKTTTIGPSESSYLLPDRTEQAILIEALRYYRFHLMAELEGSSQDPNDPDVAGLEEFIARSKDLQIRVMNLKLEDM